MPFTLEALQRRHPVLYHLTARTNLERIRSTGRLESAAPLLSGAGEQGMTIRKRPKHLCISVGGQSVSLRDQAALHERNMRLEDGWAFDDFVRYLNEQVFFWPGGETGPNEYGVRHFARYASENPVIIRVPFASLVARNPATAPRFSKFNSGSPRWSAGVPPRRGKGTFVAAAAADFGPGAVVEVTFEGSIFLPRNRPHQSWPQRESCWAPRG